MFQLDNEDSTGSPSQRTDSDNSSKGCNLPPELQRFSYAFPFTPMGPVKDIISLIRNYLPSWEQASAMAESYLVSATWIFRSVTRHQLVNEMLPSIYRKLPYPSEEYNGPHDLALLFSIFALGSALDVSLPTRTAESEGEHYNQLALAALCLQPVLEKPSLVTIQTLHIVSIYHAMLGNDVSGGESSMEFTWSLVNLAAHLAQTVRYFDSKFAEVPIFLHRLDYVSFKAHRVCYNHSPRTQIVILLNGRPVLRLSKGVGWFSGTCLLRTRGMYVEHGDNFCSSRD